MRKFATTLLLFVIPLLVINFIFYKIVDKFYQRPYLERSNLNNFRTFIFSDSHGEPLQEYLEEYGIYNISMVSDSYADMLRKLTYLIKNKKIDRAIVTADDHALAAYREGANNNDRSIHLIDYADFRRISPSSNFFEYFEEKYLTHYIVLLNSKSRGFLVTYFEGLLKSKSNKPLFGGDWSKRKDRNKSAVRRANVQFSNVSPSEELKESLLKMIELCKENNVELIGIKFPLSKDYIAAIGDRSSGADGLLKTQGIMVLDFKNAFVQGDSLFSNQDHLNQVGGKIFSQKIIESLK